ncbi:B3 domain-containing protein [Tripterygium wilfordii]|uniref:B3 domain-containing protein n=1 Tax=Tripterygium wilfordii TaxID=458696 RepID=A0A7J7D745_TRIWF|nr:B3 domain-containing protein [Tripterygium wilfordii]
MATRTLGVSYFDMNFHVEVKDSEKISDVKRKIHDQTGFLIDRQILARPWLEILEDEASVSSIDTDNIILQLFIVDIRIKLPDDEEMNMEVKVVDTVRCIMEKIQEAREIPVSSQELLLKGEILDQENEICTYEFTQNCLIKVNLIQHTKIGEEQVEKDLKHETSVKRQRVRTPSLELFIASIGGTDLQMIMEKKLTYTDMTSYMMSISGNAMKSIKFLTDEEKQMLQNKGNIDAKFIGPDFKIGEMGFRQRDSLGYLLGSKWAKVRKIYELKQGDTVQLWSFRDNGKLGLALLCKE